MINKKVLSLIKDVTDSGNISAAEMAEWIDTHFEDIEYFVALKMFEYLDEAKGEVLKEHYENLDAFRKRLFATWESPLKRLDALIYGCTEISDEVNSEYRTNPGIRSARLNIATRLHARAVQVSCEISHLLKGGFADGAMARWRTLHETTAILIFIAEGDEDLAKRFTDFQSIQRKKAANRYNKYSGELGFTSFSSEDLSRFDLEREGIVGKYEAGFGNDFGWAAKALGKEPSARTKVRFSDIEEFVELDFLRPHYGFANQYIHAGIDSIGFKLGTSLSNKDLLLCGPSNEGLLEPIQCTSLSLIQATQAIISVSPDDQRLLYSAVLWLWHERLKEEVVAASDALMKKGKAYSCE
ncbi:DUF5677 domain-containing protein [Pectobacterium aroidearum]|uniref:Uncharacterized protein n=1 Tax=Pectobacterium polaris TaxID=2042057 RepID=A0AAW4P555_9GAMM|nr:hypothetical protein [Pectobacterium polaris]